MLKRPVFLTLSAATLAALLAGCGDKPLTYQADIKPIIDANCVSCHVPGGTGYDQTGLQLDSYDALMKGTKLGPVVVAGSSVSSTLYRLVSGQADPSIRMPHGQGALPDAEVSKIAAWIDQGAKN
ncbi:MAG: c-type cytochrome [Thiobacillaceae bacterium]|jgi:mono/diheme cytochrome c family protein|nr:c-type cytochrome [Thiobacillaceae bacterium]